MRNLLLLIGSQLQGKTTWVKDNNLEDHTLSMDELRLRFLPRVSTIDGHSTIPGDKNDIVFKTFSAMLESRMNAGSFIVIDNMNNKESDLNWYKDLSLTYGYKIWYRDFRNTNTLEQCLLMNSIRQGNHMGNDAIITHYNHAKNLKVHKNITEIKELIEIPSYNGIQFNHFSRKDFESIFYIGDIHGCLNDLKTFIDKYYTQKSYYVFTGDYVDRGPDSVGVMRLLSALHLNGNVLLLEGNHEKWVRLYGANKDNMIKNKGFLSDTVAQFNEKQPNGGLNFTRSDARSFAKKLKVFAGIKYGGKLLFASHGGVNRLEISDKGYRTFPANHYISGTGNYSNLLEMYATEPELHNSHDLNWLPKKIDHVIHGHRNRGHVTRTGKYINLEGSIEQGGNLKAVRFNSDGTSEDILVKATYNYLDDGNKALIEFRESDHIKESILSEGLSAFNFTRELFYKRTWSRVTVKARGLFVDTARKVVAARSYDKFFNIEETTETSLEKLRNVSYPLEAFEKGNGYLGIVSSHPHEDGLLICSKSTNKGEYAEVFKSHLKTTLDLDLLDDFCKKMNVSLVFEVVDPAFDPHIIEYKKSELILLDIIPNSFVYSTWSFDKLQGVLDELMIRYPHVSAQRCTVRVKRLEETINTYEELCKHIVDNKYLKEEGFVYRDSKGFMFKYKTSFYNFLKTIRTQLERSSEGVTDDNLVTAMMSKLNERGMFLDNALHSTTNIATKKESMKFVVFALANKNRNIVHIYSDFKRDNPDFLEPLRPYSE